MKSVIKQVSAILLFAVLAVSAANAQSSDEALIGKARAAAHECLQPFYEGGNYDIGASVETTGICFVEGFLKSVTFYAGPKCVGPNPCPLFATRIIATVGFDCDGNVIAIDCITQ